MDVVTISNAETVGYQKGKEGLAFLQGRISEKATKVRNRIHLNSRLATEEEKTLLASFKAAARALLTYTAKTPITALTVGSGITPLQIISENFDVENVVGTREEQVASLEAFKKKQKADLEALDAIRQDLDAAYYTNTAGSDLATPLAAALAKLSTID